MENRRTQIVVKVSEDEKEKIERLASSYSLGVSPFVRMVLLKGESEQNGV